MLPPTFICAAYLSKGPADLYSGTQKSLRHIDFCFEIKNRKDEAKMNTNSASKKAISMVCLIAWYYFTGSIIDPGYFRKRSWLERSGADHWCNRHFTGNVFIPDIKTSQKHR